MPYINKKSKNKIDVKLVNNEDVLIYEFHHDYIEVKCDNKSNLLFTNINNLMYEIKTEDFYEHFSSDKEMFNFSNYLTKSKYYDNSKKLVFRKMKDATGGFTVEELFGWISKMYSLLVDNSEHKKAKDLNENVIATVSCKKYKDVLLNNEWIRHSINRIQSNDHRMGTYEIKKIFLFCFDDKIYIQNNGYNRLALGY